ncbi:flagellar hook protein FlgE [Nitratidesulfovibrio liaohensis]|uniref:flagellar hook protein FlgE n=1 Tax=Nitratidesulfovibrio liaohensis TaxID=2604158 RepID=UPI00142471DF|nr:flagellar hook protein FlgE [Nitratidesulfovibrio liaohensis]NHZ45166.1 flagellar hook protein FlgE [Nitratidesulfovibrio liaohensis]
MSVTASMWTGVSGLLAHGEKMNVLGNNIANVNTVGFKGSRMDFQDFINQDVYSAAGVSQVGRGVSIGAIFGDFSQGAFETTNEATDLAIGGKGFFQVRPKGQETSYYTRAGNFRFDNDGYLVDPHGYVLQGWEIEKARPSLSTSTAQVTTTTSQIKGAGSPKDIKLDGFTAEPQHTSTITSAHNLDARDGGDKSVNAANPFFSVFNNWDGSADTPLADSRFAYQTTIKVYDEGGTSHELTVYFDQVATDTVAGAASGKRYWEYMVTMNPSDDLRSVNGQNFAGTSAAGILMTGTLTFDTSGQLTDMTAFTIASGATGSLKDMNNWVPTTFSNNGYPLFVANFSGVSNASYTSPTVPQEAEPYLMELNFGLRNLSNTWASAPASAAAIGSNASSLGGLGPQGERQSTAMTSYGGPSSMIFQKQDGYTFGFLQNITVDQDGVVHGRYSNGVILDLYQITLYDFTSPTNLRREGGNLFSETRASGDALAGPANANGYGSINSNSLEQSNVDLAREFVQMITTQRGFQSNSKVITTTDTMLETVVNMKR